MGYLDPQHDAMFEPTGADVTVSGGNLAVARLQAAINRVISGARTDSGILSSDENLAIIVIGLQAQARATPLIDVDGVLGLSTSAGLRTAAELAGIINGTPVQQSITTVSQMTAATDQLTQAAERRSYPVTDTVSSDNPLDKIPLPPGVPPRVAGIPTVVLIAGAVGLGLVFVLRKRKNPARRSRRRR